MLTPNKLIFTSGGSYICATFGKNPSRNATIKSEHRRIHRYTDRRKPVL